MERFDELLFKLLSEKHPGDGEKARLVFKRVLLVEKRKKALATLFLISLSYPFLYYFVFGLPLGLLTGIYSFFSGTATLVNLGLTSYLLTLLPILMLVLTLLVYVFTRAMKLNRISLRII